MICDDASALWATNAASFSDLVSSVRVGYKKGVDQMPYLLFVVMPVTVGAVMVLVLFDLWPREY
jgi:hypothetical protein